MDANLPYTIATYVKAEVALEVERRLGKDNDELLRLETTQTAAFSNLSASLYALQTRLDYSVTIANAMKGASEVLQSVYRVY
jgi:hypothetical protein